eukprot:1149279-Pelagomonas_calceolata.AAC.2
MHQGWVVCRFDNLSLPTVRESEWFDELREGREGGSKCPPATPTPSTLHLNPSSDAVCIGHSLSHSKCPGRCFRGGVKVLRTGKTKFTKSLRKFVLERCAGSGPATFAVTSPASHRSLLALICKIVSRAAVAMAVPMLPKMQAWCERSDIPAYVAMSLELQMLGRAGAAACADGCAIVVGQQAGARGRSMLLPCSWPNACACALACVANIAGAAAVGSDAAACATWMLPSMQLRRCSMLTPWKA